MDSIKDQSMNQCYPPINTTVYSLQRKQQHNNTIQTTTTKINCFPFLCFLFYRETYVDDRDDCNMRLGNKVKVAEPTITARDTINQ